MVKEARRSNIQFLYAILIFESQNFIFAERKPVSIEKGTGVGVIAQKEQDNDENPNRETVENVQEAGGR